MNEQAVELSLKIDEMLGVIERDIEHIDRTISQLDELRGLVIKRDEQGLRRLLEEIQVHTQGHLSNEQNRRILREKLAEMLGCKTQEMTLSFLKAGADAQTGNVIVIRQQKLRALTQNLQREYALTVRMLSECSRINSNLLKIIFERGEARLVCYDSDGTTARKSDAAFMSTRV